MLADAQPLVSCIMPTYNRRAFVPRAIDYFLRQDYANKELIIVDDGTDPVADLVPADEHIRYIRLKQKTAVGTKRNLACEQARGEIIAHWDDDDWHAPHRLRYQVEELLRNGAEVCGLNRLLFYDLNSGQAWQYVYPPGLRFWLNGSALCYRRTFWTDHRFASLDVGEDARFVWSGRPEQMLALPDSTFHVGIIHGHNVAPKETGGAYWQPHPADAIQRLLGDDLTFYRPPASLGDALQVAALDSGIQRSGKDLKMVSMSETVSAPHTVTQDDHAKLDADSIYLDTLPLVHAEVGYGSLGQHGSLGYEHKSVIVWGRTYPHALSTHPPARLVFQLEGRFTRFRCQVALNDDVGTNGSHANFRVLADERQVALAAHIVAGAAPHSVEAGVQGAQQLELVVDTSRWEYCHAVWLDPQLDWIETVTPYSSLFDCLGRVEIVLPNPPPRARHCIATVVSPSFSWLLDDMLGSLYANGCCQDALVIVFAVDPDNECRRVSAKYGATLIPCSQRARVNATVKAVLYSVARVVDAEQFLCFDADMLILGDLRPIFAMLEACTEGTILACREANGFLFNNLEHALCTVYRGRASDIALLVGTNNGEGAYPLVVNDGLFAGSRAALLALDGVIRSWTRAPAWVDEYYEVSWRNQWVFNLALAHLRCGSELKGIYNVQLCYEEVAMHWAKGCVQALWRGQMARVLHFNGPGRHKYLEWRRLFAQVQDPLIGYGSGDGYAAFLVALRGWVGRYGLTALAWSFYGTTDARSAQVSDPATLPLLACLHYLIRANGCVRVLETGTARGVSAACLASAVAHRVGAQVVTFDNHTYDERATLWAALPESIQTCIEPRACDSLSGLAAALAAGEHYEAALLDSLHTEEHIWAEFQLATQLVCPGGLILIHDVRNIYGTVEQALQRIAAAGYSVVRLWMPEAGVCEDDHLGLAVIENRCRTIHEVR